MKPPLKVGDRVSVVGYGLGAGVATGSPIYFDGERGQVFEVKSYGIIEVKVGKILGLYHFHPKQCRRLVKKKRREIWVNIYKDFEAYHDSKESADADARSDRIRCVRFIEAREKKEG